MLYLLVLFVMLICFPPCWGVEFALGGTEIERFSYGEPPSSSSPSGYSYFTGIYIDLKFSHEYKPKINKSQQRKYHNFL
ncbi:MAG: hypothetical protein ACPL4I_12960, partial [Bacteroidota bacterium]